MSTIGGPDAAQVGFTDLRDGVAVNEQDPSSQALTTGQTGLYPQFILFGDSITQGAHSTVQPRLQSLYVRQADIVNRGFSGYTAPLGLSVLPYFLPPSTSGPSHYHPSIQLLTIFFGANDACPPGNAQHVPLDTFVDSLRQIAEYPVFKQHGTRIILITPAPVDEWQLSKPLTRTAVNAKRYAHSIKQLAEEMRIPCVDLWTRFMELAGYTMKSINHISKSENGEDGDQALTTENQPKDQQADPNLPGSLSCEPSTVLNTLLADGLHFAPAGYDVLYDELIAVINQNVPECRPENMPWVFRYWKDVLGVPQEPATETKPAGLDCESGSTLQGETEVDDGEVKIVGDNKGSETRTEEVNLDQAAE